MKSFFSTRIAIVAKKPVSNRTVTHELMMENQWIEQVLRQERVRASASPCAAQVPRDALFPPHRVRKLHRRGVALGDVHRSSGSVETLISTSLAPLYATSKCTCVNR